MMIQLPHDLKTHRSVWRGLLLEKIRIEREVVEQRECDNANLLYWQHELEAFDQCFKQLDEQDVEFTL